MWSFCVEYSLHFHMQTDKGLSWIMNVSAGVYGFYFRRSLSLSLLHSIYCLFNIYTIQKSEIERWSNSTWIKWIVWLWQQTRKKKSYFFLFVCWLIDGTVSEVFKRRKENRDMSSAKKTNSLKKRIGVLVDCLEFGPKEWAQWFGLKSLFFVFLL